MKQRLISLDKLKEYPIRLDHYDKENGSKQFVYGVESVLEYADYLPTVEAIPIEWVKKFRNQFEPGDDDYNLIDGLLNIWRLEHETD